MKDLRKLLFIASTVLFVISLIGTILAFRIPETIEVKNALVSYEHTGRLAYLAYLKPSYIYGPEPAASTTTTTTTKTTTTAIPLSKLKYPENMIERIDFSYQYRFVPESPVLEISGKIDVTASGIDSDKKTVTIDLVKGASFQADNASFTFNLPFDDKLPAGNITLSIDIDTTIKTEQGPVFESFTQRLTLERGDTLVSIDRQQLTLEQTGNPGFMTYDQTGSIDYTVIFRAESALVPLSVKLPPVTTPVPEPTPTTTPLPLKTVKPGEVTLYTKLLDHVDASFQYDFNASSPVENLSQEVEIVGLLEGTDKWSKQITLVPGTRKDGAFKLDFPLDIARFTTLIDDIKNETGASAEEYKLTIQAYVHVTGKTDYGNIDEVFSPAWSTAMNAGTLEWTEELRQTKAGAIETTDTVKNTRRYLGFSRDALRYFTMVLAFIFYACLMFSLWLGIRSRRYAQVPFAEKESQRIHKKYGERMVDTIEPTTVTVARTIKLDSIDGLMTIADELGKPVIHQSPGTAADKHTYHVYDGEIRYEYVLEEKGK